MTPGLLPLVQSDRSRGDPTPGTTRATGPAGPGSGAGAAGRVWMAQLRVRGRTATCTFLWNMSSPCGSVCVPRDAESGSCGVRNLNDTCVPCVRVSAAAAVGGLREGTGSGTEGGTGMHWRVPALPPPQGAQPMPSHCPPDGKCQPQWHL